MVPGFSVLMATRVVPFHVPNQKRRRYLLSLPPDKQNTPYTQESQLNTWDGISQLGFGRKIAQEHDKHDHICLTNLYTQKIWPING